MAKILLIVFSGLTSVASILIVIGIVKRELHLKKLRDDVKAVVPIIPRSCEDGDCERCRSMDRNLYSERRGCRKRPGFASRIEPVLFVMAIVGTLTYLGLCLYYRMAYDLEFDERHLSAGVLAAIWMLWMVARTSRHRASDL